MSLFLSALHPRCIPVAGEPGLASERCTVAPPFKRVQRMQRDVPHDPADELVVLAAQVVRLSPDHSEIVAAMGRRGWVGLAWEPAMPDLHRPREAMNPRGIQPFGELPREPFPDEIFMKPKLAISASGSGRPRPEPPRGYQTARALTYGPFSRRAHASPI